MDAGEDTGEVGGTLTEDASDLVSSGGDLVDELDRPRMRLDQRAVDRKDCVAELQLADGQPGRLQADDDDARAACASASTQRAPMVDCGVHTQRADALCAACARQTSDGIACLRGHV